MKNRNIGHAWWKYYGKLAPLEAREIIPKIRLQDAREPEFDPQNPLILDGHAFGVWHHLGQWYMIAVPHEFKTDAASVPRFLWPLVSPLALGRIAFLVHDYIIKKKGDVQTLKWCSASGQWVQDVSLGWDRKHTDKLFFRLLSNEMKEWALPTIDENASWLKRSWQGIKRAWIESSRRQRRRWAYRAIRAHVLTKQAFGRGEW